MKTLKFEASEELLVDLTAIHGIDIVDQIKNKLLELEKTWEVEYPDVKVKLKFHLKPVWIKNFDGSESFSFTVIKENISSK